MENPQLTRKERRAEAIKRYLETGKLCSDVTNVKKKGQEFSLNELNSQVCMAKTAAEAFAPMKTIMTAIASAKGYIKKGQSKIRKGGSPDDFLNFVTMKMCDRWQNQKNEDLMTGVVGKTNIENWCAYANIVLYTLLIEYNTSVLDLNLRQIPMQKDDNDEWTEVEIEDTRNFEEYLPGFELEAFSKEQILLSLENLPITLKEFAIDIVYYALHEAFLDPARKNFALVGINFFRRGLTLDE